MHAGWQTACDSWGTFRRAMPSGRNWTPRTSSCFRHCTEGLPRALIEAMARALPCIGSSVGGIPELLSPSEQVPPGEVDALSNKILEILGDRERCCRLSRENLQRARDYHVDALHPRRRAFYRAVQEATTEWQRRDRQRRDFVASPSEGRSRLTSGARRTEPARDRRGSGGETVGAVRVQGVSCRSAARHRCSAERGKGTRPSPARCNRERATDCAPSGHT